jgi:hypothetical protein
MVSCCYYQRSSKWFLEAIIFGKDLVFSRNCLNEYMISLYFLNLLFLYFNKILYLFHWLSYLIFSKIHCWIWFFQWISIILRLNKFLWSNSFPIQHKPKFIFKIMNDMFKIECVMWNVFSVCWKPVGCFQTNQKKIFLDMFI